MADSKLSALVAMGTTPANNDELYIRDVSAAVADQSLKIVVSDLLAAYNVLSATMTNKTLTSPTINGGTHTAVTGLGVRSTGTGAFDLTLANSENLTAGRTLTVTLNDAARTLTISGNTTVSGTNTGDNAGVTAVTGTAPVASSGGATPAISITGAAGQVLAGAGPAFTATPTLGASGTLGSLAFGNATSGTVTIQPVAGALGTVTLSLPAATDTLVGRATTDTLTNKSINLTSNTLVATSAQLATALTDETGSGAAVFGTAPTIVGGTHTALTGLGIRSTGTGAFDLTLANSENLTVGRTLTITLNDAARTLTISGNATVSGTNTGDNAGVTAVTGTAPVASSGGNTPAISITGAAGQVLAGAGPAFTATPTLGASGTLGSLALGNATSGTITLQPVTGALGTVTLSLPAATDTLVGRATTDTLTNKSMSETQLTFTDVTTGNVSITAHGFTPKLPNDATKFLDGTGAYTAPPGSGTAAWSAITNPAGALVLSMGTNTSTWTYTAGKVVWDGTGIPTFGAAALATGAIKFAGTTSGTITVTVADAAGTGTLTLPAATDTLVGKATTDTLTNKTLTSPTLTAPALGTPASGVMTNVTGLTEAGQTLADNTTNDVSTTKHGYVPKAPNNTTTFLRGDATFAAPASSGAITRVGGNTTEATTTSTTAVDLLTVTSLSIVTSTPFMIIGSGRKTSGAAASAGGGLKLNTTVTSEALGGTARLFRIGSNTNAAHAAAFHHSVSPILTDYDSAGVGQSADTDNNNIAGVGNVASNNAKAPVATITDIVIRGIVANALITMGVDEVHVYTYAVS